MGLVYSAGHGEQMVYNTLGVVAVGSSSPLLQVLRKDAHLQESLRAWGSCFYLLALTAFTPSLLPPLSMASGGLFPVSGCPCEVFLSFPLSFLTGLSRKP